MCTDANHKRRSDNARRQHRGLQSEPNPPHSHFVCCLEIDRQMDGWMDDGLIYFIGKLGNSVVVVVA